MTFNKGQIMMMFVLVSFEDNKDNDNLDEYSMILGQIMIVFECAIMIVTI